MKKKKPVNANKPMTDKQVRRRMNWPFAETGGAAREHIEG